MSRARDLLPVIALPVGALLIAVVASRYMKPVEASSMVGHAAPGIALPIVAGPGAAAGDRIDLARLRGRAVMLDFWASWCAPCRQTIPILNGIRRRFARRGLTVLGVDLERSMSPSDLVAAHHALGSTFPSLQDTTGEVQEAYGVAQLPTLVLIDREGVVVHVGSGVPDEGELERRIDRILQ